MKAAAYARFSTDHQCSIDVQFKRIKDHCEGKGYTLLQNHMYQDEGLSGLHIDHRRDFNAMCSAAIRHEFDVIVLYDLTRGSRDVVDWFTFRRQMQQLGIQVESCFEKIGNLDDPGDFITELIQVGIGQAHVLTSRIKSMDKIDLLAEKGQFCGGYAPFGYAIENGKYIIVPNEAATVRMIFERYAAGQSYADIIDALPPGLRGRKGREFGKNTLHYMLKNKRYAGTYSWCEREVKYMSQWAGGRPSPRRVVIENQIPPIVDKATWERVRLRMKKNKHNSVNKSKRVYLLSGLVQCGECGAAMFGATSKSKNHEYTYYKCGAKHRKRTCDADNIDMSELDQIVTNAVMESIHDGSLVDATIEAYMQSTASQMEDGQVIDREILSLESKIMNLTSVIADGLDSPSVRTSLLEYEKEKQKLEMQKEFIQNRPTPSKESIKAQLTSDIKKLSENNEGMRDLLQKYIVKVVVSNNSIEIVSSADPTQVPKKPTTPDISEVVNTTGCGSPNYPVLITRIPR